MTAPTEQGTTARPACGATACSNPARFQVNATSGAGLVEDYACSRPQCIGVVVAYVLEVSPWADVRTLIDSED